MVEDIDNKQGQVTTPLPDGRGQVVGIHPFAQFHFCPKCGSPRFVEHDAKSKHCEDCGFTYYFNPSAATVALIERPARQPHPQTPPIREGSCCSQQSSDGEALPLTGERGAGLEWLCVRRAKDPARGTLDLPGGFSDMFETSEEGVIREVKEETNLDVDCVEFLFSIPNQYEFSGFLVHTIDMFYRCHVKDTTGARAADDAGELLWLRPEDINPADFGLHSIRRGIEKLLKLQL